MKTYSEIFNYYKRFHTNPKNIMIHRLTVPLIFLSSYGLLIQIPTPGFFEKMPFLNWGNLTLALLLIYFAKFGIKIFAIMLAFLLAISSVVLIFRSTFLVATGPLYATIFIMSWVLQILGHKIEGKRPAFIEDLHALPLGLILAFSNKNKDS